MVLSDRSIKISRKDARKMVLFAQGLATNAAFGKKKTGAIKAIERLGYLQIDTISVVARAHHHTIWARVPEYKPEHLLDMLNKERSIFEYWSHAAAFLPIKDYRFARYRMEEIRSGKTHWWPRDKKTEAFVRKRIQEEGPLRSADFESKKPSGSWYGWKPAKKALNNLFMDGTLMISARSGFQKVYDLTERVLPEQINTRLPDDQEMADYLILRNIEAQGLVREKEISYLRKGRKKMVRTALDRLLEESQVVKIEVQGLEGSEFFTTPQNLDMAGKRYGPKTVHLLCPFDNLIIQRQRPADLFNFDYKLECYVPAGKREKGYYTLPVLFGDRFVAQIDAKADRKQKVLQVKAFHLEDARDRDRWQALLIQKLEAYATFNGCTKTEHSRIK